MLYSITVLTYTYNNFYDKSFFQSYTKCLFFFLYILDFVTNGGIHFRHVINNNFHIT